MKENTRSPQLALTLGNYIKQAATLKCSMAIEQGNAAKKAQIQSESNDFMALYNAQWKYCVSSKAIRTQRLRRLNKFAEK